MPMEEFEVGHVVQLKSGGPLMTVRAVQSTVQVVWFNEQKGTFDIETFDPELLKRAGNFG